MYFFGGGLDLFTYIEAILLSFYYILKVIEEPDDGPEFEEETDNGESYEVEGYDRDEQVPICLCCVQLFYCFCLNF